MFIVSTRNIEVLPIVPLKQRKEFDKRVSWSLLRPFKPQQRSRCSQSSQLLNEQDDKKNDVEWNAIPKTQKTLLRDEQEIEETSSAVLNLRILCPGRVSAGIQGADKMLVVLVLPGWNLYWMSPRVRK